MQRRKPWQKNLRKIPTQIREKIDAFHSDECIVSCIIKVNLATIQSGMFDHLNVRLVEDKLEFPEQIIPPSAVGIYSKRNRVGYEVVYKTLPKTIKSWFIDAPNYGDWLKGSHDVEFRKRVYQREFVAPKLVAIQIEQIGEDIRDQARILKFAVHEVLDRKSVDFDKQLFFNLNLLQENTGNHDVYESQTSLDDYLSTLYVNWEILPPGDREETLTRILSGIQSHDPKVRARIIDRYDFLRALNPRNFIKGINEFRRYFGAQFADDLVVFENIDYGNAIYVMFDNWEALSKKSRTELLSSNRRDFQRIPHTKTWKRRLRKLVAREVDKRKAG